MGGLVQGGDGEFYGATVSGGARSESGTLFKITPTGSLTTLYAFPGGAGGADPRAALVQGTDGYFYGTAQDGTWGSVVFRLSSSGNVTNLWSPASGQGPCYLAASLVQGNDGCIYGTSFLGGPRGIDGGKRGTVFRICVGSESTQARGSADR